MHPNKIDSHSISDNIALKLCDVSHHLKKTPIINSVNISVARGKVFSLLGPSGCGKTTILRLIAGLEKPSTGEIFLNQQLVSDRHHVVPPEARKIAMVFQDYALFPHLNVYENIGFALTNNPEKHQIVQHLMHDMELQMFEKSYPHTLSGGQQQRVAIARAIASKPSLMLLDEPFSNLDTRLRDEIRDTVLHLLKQHNIPTVIVTHDAEEAMYMSDIIGVMRNGNIEQIGIPNELYFKPVNEFVASSFGDVNRFDGWLEGQTIKSPLGEFDINELHIKPNLPISNSSTKEQHKLLPQKVNLLARPEGLSLKPSKSSKALQNEKQSNQNTPILARVLAARHLGRTSLIHMCIDDPSGQNIHLHARVTGRHLPKEGTMQHIKLDPKSLFVFLNS